jgi:hypothetical protein
VRNKIFAGDFAGGRVAAMNNGYLKLTYFSPKFVLFSGSGNGAFDGLDFMFSHGCCSICFYFRQ